MRREFASAFPKVAGRLSIEGLQCDDPYVERLTESHAYLAARVQLELEQSFPSFAQSMLELLCPACLSPVPSAAIVQLRPDPQDKGVASGYLLPRGRLMRSAGGSGETRCTWRTAHDVTLLPLRIDSAHYFTARDLGPLKLPGGLSIADPGGGRKPARAALQLVLTSLGPPIVEIAKAGLNRLPIYLPGSDDAAGPQRLWAQLIRHSGPIIVRCDSNAQPQFVERGVHRHGFDPQQAMIPAGPRLAEPHRLILEYLTLPERFRFIELRGLRRALLAACSTNPTATSIEIVLPLWAEDSQLENVVAADNFALHCTPIVNLFPQETARQRIDNVRAELPLIVDRAKPLDHEVWSVDEIQGYSGGAEPDAIFRPMFEPADPVDEDAGSFEARGPTRHFSFRRIARRATDRELSEGSLRSRYPGTEVLITLGHRAGDAESLRQIGGRVWCTNRDLALGASIAGESSLSLMQGEPVQSIVGLSGAPTLPRSGPAWVTNFRPEGDDDTSASLPMAWQLVNALGINHVPLAGAHPARTAAPLRTLLRLLGGNENNARAAAASILEARAETIVRRVRSGDVDGFVRGLLVTLQIEDNPPPPGGSVLLGAVLEQVLTRSVAINSFIETIVSSPSAGRLSHFRPTLGRRYLV